ncbi:uncharacterized protein LOC129915428 isoform X2 [Episyrphus balteatus]|nr:uncharacterized protein LOC129915428 isoform X2 [Episyrphus balteatus]
MAAVNSVQSGLHLPLAGLSPPRVLMCSASMGAEGSVTLQLREAIHSSDSSSVDGYSSLDNALTIGYPDPDMLADVLGSLQTASLNNNSNSNNTMISAITLENVDGSKLNDIGSAISSTPNNNNNNSNGGKSSNSNSSNSNNNSKTFNNNSLISCSSNISLNSPISGQIISITGGSSSGSSGSSSNCSTTSNSSCSSSSNESISNVSVPGSNPPIVKKQRPKTSSPTRHGPQQCQVCSKVFGNASALAKHKLTHSDERKYVCVMCSKAFKRQDHLNGHMMTHRNKKPYECKAEGCGKSYCDARSLRRHTENHHSGLAAAATTPQNQSSSLSPSTGPPTGLSLSPATASGDASSPHGANCIQYTTMGGGDDGSGSNSNSSVKQSSSAVNVSVVSSSTQANSSSSQCYSVTSSPASSPSSNASSVKSIAASEGLTRQQLDLISQIMQQTKQGNTQLTVASTSANLKITNQPPSPHQSSQAQSTQHQLQRPRTWNMQTQLQQTQSKVSVIENSTSPITSISINELLNGSGPHSQQQQQQQQQQQHLSSAAAINQQILNIVKLEQKPVECNLCHRKFKNVPALNGHMRLHGGYFKKEAETKKCDRKDGLGGPPLQTASIGVRALIEEKIISKRCKDLKGAFVVPAPPITAAIRRTASDLENFLTPKSPIVLQSGNSPSERNNNLPDIGNAILPSGLQIQKQPIPVQQKPSNVSVGTATVSTNTSKATSTMDHKDATLIELLKRGTKVAVRKTSNSDSSQIFTTSSGTLMLPSELSLSTTSGTSTNPPLAITLPNGETTPVSLTISQASNGSGDVYTLTYSTDSAASFFEDSDVYSVSETDMLLQTVDSIQLLNESEEPDHLDEINSLSDFHNDTNSSSSNLVVSRNNNNNKDMQTVFSSPLQDALPDFQTLHSKDFVLYNNGTCKAINNGGNHTTASKSLATVIKQSISPLPSPLAYPTPPASHETVAQASPFLDDSHHFSDAANSFFQEKSTSDFIDDAGGTFFKDCSNEALTESQKILKLKSVLEDSGQFFKSGDDNSNDVFDTSVVKVEDLLNESNDGANCDLKDFAEQNLSFLEDAQGFLDDSRNATSPLSESFFTSGIGTAEEVKEVLRDVLPDESLNCDPQNSTDIDLYYLPGLGLQSQMMPNSEDPLLSSSPRDFGHRLSVQPHHQQTQMIRIEQQQTTTMQGQLIPKKPDASEQSYPLLMATSTSRDGSTEFHFTIQQQDIKQDNETPDVKPDLSSVGQMCVDNQQLVVAAQQLPPPPFKESSSSVSIKTQQYFGVNEISAQNLLQPQPQNILAAAATASPLTSSILKRRLRQGSLCGDSNSHHSNSIPRKYELYKSKLRKPSTTHYTPQPILNPGRKGTGLYSNLPKPPTFAQDTLHLDDEFEEAASIMAFLDESKVNIGTAYQATIPPLETTRDPHPAMDGGQLFELTDHEEMMWDPSVATDEKILTRYIELSKSSAIPLGYHSEEVALKALLEVHGDTPIAVLNLLKSQSNPFQLKWSSLEVEMFLRGLEKYGKDFYSISREIITKSTSECIQLYYFWKKLCVDYKMTHLKVETDDVTQSQFSSQVSEHRPHVCEMPDCSASFTSKAALHGHTRIHCIGRNMNQVNHNNNNNNTSMILTNNGQLQSHSNLKDDFPCKVCGKVFNKVKSRSAHMKSHRPQENDSNNLQQQQTQQQHPPTPQQQQQQLQQQSQIQNTNSL